MKIGDLFLAVIADDKGFQADLVKKAGKAGDVAGKTLGSKMSGGLKDAFKGGKGDLLGMLGLGAGLGVATVGLSKLVGFLGESVEAASNLSEATAKAGEVFDESTPKVEAWAKTAATSMGLSERAALEASGTLGNLLLSMGKTSAEAGDMSMTMVRLAADLASFNNVDVEEVLMAIRSGLTGEIAPLRRFGVNLTDVTLKQKAMSLGLYRGSGLLDVNAKSAAAYALILEQTQTAQGDFARTSDGLANTQRSLTAAMEDAQAEIGEALLPVMVELSQMMRDEIVPGIVATSDAFDDLFGSRMDEKTTAIGKLDQQLTDFIADFLDFATPWDDYVSSSDERTGALEADRRKLAETAFTAAHHTAPGLRDVGDAAGGMGDTVEDASSRGRVSMGKMADGVRALRDAFIAAAGDIIDDYYDPIQTKQEQQALRREAAELRETIASEDSTKAQIADAKRRLTEIEKTSEKNILELARHGALNAKQMASAFDDLTDKIESSKGKQQAYYIWLRRQLQLVKLAALAASGALKGGAGIGSGTPGRAHGGPVTGGRPYLVNENTARSEIFVPDVSGHVVTQAAATMAAGSAMGGNTYQVNVQGLLKAEDPEDIARALQRVASIGQIGLGA